MRLNIFAAALAADAGGVECTVYVLCIFKVVLGQLNKAAGGTR